MLAPARSLADVDPAGCTDGVGYDPAVPTYEAVVGRPLGDGPTGNTGRDVTADIYKYFRAVKDATAANPRVRMLEKSYGKSVLGQDLAFWVLSSPDNIDNLDAGRKDAAFWAGVRDGSVSEAAGLAAVRSRPAPAWITSTPHGAEPAAGEAIARNLYELAARTDCWNAMRLRDMDFFLLPVRNPDGRDAIQRTSAWTFDHNRDFGTQNQIENGAFLPLFKQYPGVFFIDAHQTGNGYFFPPNEDPVHHEISDFTVDYIGEIIGPALRQAFDDQSIDYFNFQTYDLFVPEYGDTVPSLLSGAAGMTFEKGTSEVYGKQVYEHYLAINATIDVTAQNKPVDPARLGRAVGGGRPAGRRVRPRAQRAGQPAHRAAQAAAVLRRLRLLPAARPPRGRHRRAASSTCRRRACTSTRSTRTSTRRACASSARAPRACRRSPRGRCTCR